MTFLCLYEIANFIVLHLSTQKSIVISLYGKISKQSQEGNYYGLLYIVEELLYYKQFLQSGERIGACRHFIGRYG
jgi:hypothetical protein